LDQSCLALRHLFKKKMEENTQFHDFHPCSISITLPEFL
jgi:hypothetical protein